MFCLPSLVQAQVLLGGHVFDAGNRNPLPGVNIAVKGTPNGVVTAVDGTFSLEVESLPCTLILSSVGFTRKEYPVKEASTTLKLKLTAQSTLCFYEGGTESTTVSPNDMEGGALRAEELLQGQVADAAVLPAGGAPGQAIGFQLRGVYSLMPGSQRQPLVVLNGIPIDNSLLTNGFGPAEFPFGNRLQDLHPSSISKITVVPPSAAAAKYGGQASHGALEISTHNALPYDRVTYTTLNGVEYVNKLPAQQMEYGTGWLLQPASPEEPRSLYSWGPALAAGASQTTGYAQFFQPGWQTQHHVRFERALENKQSGLEAEGGYLYHQGVLPNSTLTRGNFALGFRGQLSPRVKGGLRLAANLTNSLQLPQASSRWPGVTQTLYRWPAGVAMEPLLNGSGRMASPSNRMANPLTLATYHQQEDRVTRFMGQAFLDWEFVDGLSLHARLGQDFGLTSRGRLRPEEAVLVRNATPQDFADLETLDATTRRSFLSAYLRWQHGSYEQLRFSFELGASSQTDELDYTQKWGQGFLLSEFYHISNAVELQQWIVNQNQRFTAQFAHGSLTLPRSSVKLQAGLRREQVSNHEGATYYPYAWVNTGPLANWGWGRLLGSTLGWGRTGNVASLQQTESPNWEVAEGLSPEITNHAEWDLGLELFGLQLETKAYWSQSNNLFLSFPRQQPNAPPVFVFDNAAGMRNMGLVLGASRYFDAGPLRIHLEGRAARNWNTVTAMPENIDWQVWNAVALAPFGTLAGAVVGHPYGQVYGTYYERYLEDITQTDPVFVDRAPVLVAGNGSPARGLNNRFVGGYLPTWQGQFDVTLGPSTGSFWSIHMLWDAQQGHQRFNYGEQLMTWFGTAASTGDRYTEGVVDAVFVDGNPNTQPIAFDETYYAQYASISENFLENASWLRLRTIGVTLKPMALLPTEKELKWLKGVRVQASARNLLLFTPYSGFDPETALGGISPSEYWLAGVGTPGTKRYQLGLQVTF